MHQRFFLAEDRPYIFIIPPPYLAVPNDTEKENYQWDIVDQIRNDTHDDQNGHLVEKRTVISIDSLIK